MGENGVCLLLFELVVLRELRITSSSSEGEWLEEGALCLSFSPSPNLLELFRFYHATKTLHARSAYNLYICITQHDCSCTV